MDRSISKVILIFCPHCHRPNSETETTCTACGIIFEKWQERSILDTEHKSDRMAKWLEAYRWPFLFAVLIALPFTLRFPSYLPITDGWVFAEKFWFPLPMVNLAFHEAGHPLFGIFGIRWLTVAGGTLMQLLLPSACLFHFFRQQNNAGIGFCLFWIGTNFLNISLYMADAQLQALILTTGMSGSEGGGHDWNYLLGSIGLLKHAIGLGQIVFFLGVVLMVFTLGYGLKRLWIIIISK